MLLFSFVLILAGTMLATAGLATLEPGAPYPNVQHISTTPTPPRK